MLGLRSRGELAEGAHELFLLNLKIQNRELPYARASGQAGLMILYLVDGHVIAANGPAIKVRF